MIVDINGDDVLVFDISKKTTWWHYSMDNWWFRVFKRWNDWVL